MLICLGSLVITIINKEGLNLKLQTMMSKIKERKDIRSSSLSVFYAEGMRDCLRCRDKVKQILLLLHPYIFILTLTHSSDD